MKQSAGILLYRKGVKGLEVLLVHPGGPFFARKDNGVWSIPKGEFEDDEAVLAAAKREFAEEIGGPAPSTTYADLGTVRNKSGKTIYAFSAEGDFDSTSLKSNMFEIEWPPKSGRVQTFPEVDKAKWFSTIDAKIKLNPAQTELIDRLVEKLGLEPLPEPPQQATLF